MHCNELVRDITGGSMKIRQGFVSNSSSSSFVIIGKEIDWKDADKHENVWFIGNYLCDGKEAFEIDDQFRTKYKNREFKDCEFFSVVKTGSEDLDEAFTQSEINSITTDCVIRCFECDYSTDYEYNIDQFEENYLES